MIGLFLLKKNEITVMKKSELQNLGTTYFYETYLNALEDVNLMDALYDGRERFIELINKLPSEKLGFAYADQKWTVAEVLLHIMDTERIFQYRAFRFSRNDKTVLPGFDQDTYIIESDSLTRKKEDILAEYLAVRNSTIFLFKNMTNEQLKRVGTASDLPWSVATIGFVISGHQKHHVNILKERYL